MMPGFMRMVPVLVLLISLYRAMVRAAEQWSVRPSNGPRWISSSTAQQLR
jgi:hypothetical protein